MNLSNGAGSNKKKKKEKKQKQERRKKRHGQLTHVAGLPGCCWTDSVWEPRLTICSLNVAPKC